MLVFQSMHSNRLRNVFLIAVTPLLFSCEGDKGNDLGEKSYGDFSSIEEGSDIIDEILLFEKEWTGLECDRARLDELSRRLLSKGVDKCLEIHFISSDFEKEFFRSLGRISQSDSLKVNDLLTAKKSSVAGRYVHLGRCETLLKEEPVRAVHDFFEYAKSGNYVELVPEIIDQLDEYADFPKVDELFPRDLRHLVVKCRRALYKNWQGGGHDKELIEYLESCGFYEIYLVEALMRVQKMDADFFQSWVDIGLQNGPADVRWNTAIACSIEVKLQAEDFFDAWSFLDSFSDDVIRRRYAVQVHSFWLKNDQDSAEAARKAFQVKYPK